MSYRHGWLVKALGWCDCVGLGYSSQITALGCSTLMIDISKLTIDSTIAHLPQGDFLVEQTTLGQDVADRFERETDLPGVIVTYNCQLVGIISRQRFLEQVGRHLGRELYLKRPILVMLDAIAVPPLCIPASCEINEAATQALDRPGDVMYDPIAVLHDNQQLRLLDIRMLLLAQSHLSRMVIRTVHHQKHKLQQYLVRLKEEQFKVQETNKLLEAQQVSIRDRNQLLEQQQQELLQKNQEIAALNQKFIHISQVLSKEGKIAFQSTFESVDSISCNTDKMIKIGKALVGQLETIQGTSGLIKEISKRARFLALQAAVLANRADSELSGSELKGVSRINNDIGMLSSQSLEASQVMDGTAAHLRERIDDLTRLAREGASVAQALLQKVGRAESALSALDDLIQQQDFAPDLELGLTKDLQQRLESAGAALSELEQMANHQSMARPNEFTKLEL